MTPLQQHETGVFLTYSAREIVERRPLTVTPLQYAQSGDTLNKTLLLGHGAASCSCDAALSYLKQGPA